MPPFQIDDQFAFHPKTLGAGNEAIGVFVRAGAWCAGYLTDGFVVGHIATTLGHKKLWDDLVRVGLVEAVENGYLLHDYLHWNKPAVDVAEERVRKTQSMRDLRAKKRAIAQRDRVVVDHKPTTLPERSRNVTGTLPPCDSSGSGSGSGSPSSSKMDLAGSNDPADLPPKDKTPAQLVTDCYFAEYKRVRGKAPPFGSRDGKAVKELLASMAGDPVRVCAAIRKAFLDPFWADKATICAINADPGRFDGGLFGTLPAQARPKNAYPVQGGNGGIEYLDKLRAQREAAKDQPFEMIECIDEI